MLQYYIYVKCYINRLQVKTPQKTPSRRGDKINNQTFLNKKQKIEPKHMFSVTNTPCCNISNFLTQVSQWHISPDTPYSNPDRKQLKIM